MNTDPDSWSVVIDRAKYACFVSQFLFLFVLLLASKPFLLHLKQIRQILEKKNKKTNNLYILYIEHVTHIVKYKYRF